MKKEGGKERKEKEREKKKKTVLAVLAPVYSGAVTKLATVSVLSQQAQAKHYI